jgi:hypothetical protein
MRMIQQQVFSEEYNALCKSGKVKISSSIAKLNPFIGENNIIRVGSRLEYAHISYNAKFPSILPKQHWVSELLARHVHCSNAHTGQEHTLNILRQRVWICNARSLVRKIINKCFVCRRGHTQSSNNKWHLYHHVGLWRTNHHSLTWELTCSDLC